MSKSEDELSVPLATEIERQVGSLALSQLGETTSLALLRAAVWQTTLARLGTWVPLVVVHDLGCLITNLGRPGPSARKLVEPELGAAWHHLLSELSQTDLLRSHAAWKHRDSLIAMVLAKIVNVIRPQLPEEIRFLRPLEIPSDLSQYTRIDANSAFTRHDQKQAISWLQTLIREHLLVLITVEQLDVGAIRLLSLFRGNANATSGNDLVDLVDLYNVALSPVLSDVVDFSMELLPSILEVKRDAGQQVFSIDGYAAIERRGHLNNLLLSQLALDDDAFEQRLVDQELFYFAHEKQLENEQYLHYVLIDGSASMRGVREVFARGLALALCKRLALLGEQVSLHFFDSRLYEGVRVGASGQAEIAYLLQFRAERGRNYTRVIRQLNAELSSPRRGRNRAVIYIITHGECQFPREEVQKLALRAPIYGVFILPSTSLQLAYADLLYRVYTIDAESTSIGKRATKARQIIDDVESGYHDLRGRR